MLAYAPDRVLAGVESAPGHHDPIGIDTVKLPNAALSVPQLVIAIARTMYVLTLPRCAMFKRSTSLLCFRCSHR
jgi:hypothetical protein